MTDRVGTYYPREAQLEILDRFLDKFGADERTFAEKLKAIRMSKGGYSHLINDKGDRISKKVLETMRAYLEDREPKWALPKEGEFYCYSCETIQPEGQLVRQNKWECKSCKKAFETRWKAMNRPAYRARQNRYRALHRDHILIVRRRAYLRKTYGKFAGCIELIQKIKEEYRNVQGDN